MVGVWRWRGALLAAFVLGFVLFFGVVVDVPDVQVVDVGSSSSCTGCLARYCARQEFWSRQCSPGSPAVAVLGQGGDMPVVATTGAFGFQRAENCGGSQLQLVEFFDQVVDIPVVAQLQVPMVLYHRDSPAAVH